MESNGFTTSLHLQNTAILLRYRTSSCVRPLSLLPVFLVGRETPFPITAVQPGLRGEGRIKIYTFTKIVRDCTLIILCLNIVLFSKTLATRVFYKLHYQVLHSIGMWSCLILICSSNRTIRRIEGKVRGGPKSSTVSMWSSSQYDIPSMSP